LNDSKWLCDLAFMVDIIQYLSELNVKLQGPNQLLTSLLSNVKSFEAKLKLWKMQLEKGNTVHFPTLQKQKPASTVEYARECENLFHKFCERFQDLKVKELEFNIFATPFNVEVVNVPENFQHEVIELQSNSELMAKYNNLSLLEFYRLYVDADKFPNLRRHALKIVSLFGTTYCCEQFFSKLSITKNHLRAKLTDDSLENQLRIATSSVPVDITRLTKEKQSQPSH
uniref:HAT C-terminal dimerisation domain-containing protein n=1 Tax=Latimeria chalumnae TaxID=7897 RepID=H3APJ3_LATCH